MSVQQIPTILKTMHPQFSNQEAIKITSSQFAMMKDVIQDFCRSHDAPTDFTVFWAESVAE